MLLSVLLIHNLCVKNGLIVLLLCSVRIEWLFYSVRNGIVVLCGMILHV